MLKAPRASPGMTLVAALPTSRLVKARGRSVEMRIPLVQRMARQLRHQLGQNGNRIFGLLRIADMARHARHRHLEIDRTAAADLQRIAGLGPAGGFAHHAMINGFAALFQPGQNFPVPLMPGPSSVTGDQKADGAFNIGSGWRADARGRRDKGGDGGFHVGGAAPVQEPVLNLCGKRIVPPAIAHRHHIGMAGKAEIGRFGAQARIKIFHRRRALGLEAQAMAGKSQLRQRRLQHAQRTGIHRRHRSAANQRLGQRYGIDGRGIGHQSRSNSLIEVLARVFSSTRLTITAQ